MRNKRIPSAVFAFLILISSLGYSVFSAGSLVLEAEFANNSYLASQETEIKGFSGTGYTKLMVPGASLEFDDIYTEKELQVPLKIKYLSMGEKGIDINVSGVLTEVVTEDTKESWAELSENITLRPGKNKIIISAQNANISIDCIEIMSASVSQSAGAVKNEADTKKYKTLIDLGILEGDEEGNINPEDILSRAEFVTLIFRMLGMSDYIKEAPDSSSAFIDVSSGHWAFPAIVRGFEAELINGYGDGSFGPDDSVTYNQCLKIILSALGYRIIAENLGGYPDGYIRTAINYGLSSGVPIENKDRIKRGEAARLIENALEMHVAEITDYSENMAAVIDRNVKVYERYLKLSKAQGIVESDENTTFYGASDLGRNEVIINGEKYKDFDSKAAGLIGKAVRLYYKSDEDTKDRIIVSIIEKENKVLTIMSDEITDYKNGVLSYETVKNGKIKTAVLTKKADVIFNGIAYPDFTDSVFRPETGYIEFIDNNTDGNYDVVKITSFDNCVIDSVSGYNNIIYPKYGRAPIILDVEDPTLKFTITNNGENVSVGALRQYNIASVAASQNGKLVNICVSTKKVSGLISEYSDEDLVINGKTYEIAQSLLNEIEGGREISLKSGMTGDFYLDIFGKIAGFNSNATSGQGYAYFAGIKKGKRLEDGIQVKLFLSTGEWKVLSLPERINLNGVSTLSESLLLNSALMSGGVSVPQLIMYEGSDTEVKKITIADPTDNTENFGMAVSKQKLTFKKVGSTFLDASETSIKMNIDAGTVIFAIPAPSKEDTTPEVGDSQVLDDDTKFSMKSISSYNNDSSYFIKAFDMTDGIAKAVIHYTGGSTDSLSIDDQQPVTLVEKFSTVANADGEISKRLYGLRDGKPFNQAVDQNLDISSIKQGTVIQFDENVKNEIAVFKICWQSTDTIYTKSGKLNDRFCFVFGKTIDIVGGTAVFVTTSNSPELQTKANSERLDISLAKVYIYNKSTNTVKLGTAADIERGLDILLRVRYVEVREVIVIR